MAALTILGNDVTIDYSTPSNPILKIPYSAVAAAINWSPAPTSANEKLEPWIAGILQVLADYATNNPTVETINIVVSQPTNQTPVTRNGIANRKNSRHLVTIYSTSTINPLIDGDDL